ncbi:MULTISPECIES: potassium transporter TrkG [Eubacterium]|uniref:Potassium transporter KtrB n=1 Tax=Eubacterium album TaxID=2978477 RepID=A0ABT2M061_9FIRM|nr:MULTISPECIES: potassium transporter TrkG [unclassified Eubacterium (in: firmicutes)]MCT7397997.1 potassium transporter KtrB [Eubacterium sp. LFL-14]RHR37062.1 potassium transporter KtrB [Eubacterium sp. AF19-12LB]
MKVDKAIKATFNTNLIILNGFLVALLVGTILLMLPVSSASGNGTDFITALFTATTSLCVTGLVVVPTYAYWSIFGKVIILILIQLGGLGIISFTIGFLIIIGKKISLKERKMIQESYNLDSAQGVLKILRKIFGITLKIEGIGAILYSIQFIPEYGIVKGICYSVFHSVSAFCNAGIDIIGNDSLVKYHGNVLVNFTTVMLIICGGIGFIVWLDIGGIISEIRNKKLSPNKFIERMKLHTKLVLITTAILVGGGFLFILLFEYNNPDTLGNMTFGNKCLAALFEAVTLRTAGFITVPQAGFRDGTFMIMCGLMIVGGSPFGTAGGIKTTTLALIFLLTWSTIKGKEDIEVCRRRINKQNVRSAVAIGTIVLSILAVAIMALSFTEDAPLKVITFEAVSALGTVGLSMDFTASLTAIGKLIIIVLMFFGRVGPITIAMAMAGRARKDRKITNYPEKRVMIG